MQKQKSKNQKKVEEKVGEEEEMANEELEKTAFTEI